LDLRVDKRWYFSKWTLNAYLDIQNFYNFEITQQPYIDVEKDAQGNPLTDPNDPLRYLTSSIENTSGNVLPSIGLMVEF
jgi:hypothetical protein